MMSTALAMEPEHVLRGLVPVRPAVTSEAISLLAAGQVSVRPVRPDDVELIQAYVRGLSPASRYFRFLGAISELSATELHRATHPSASSASLVLETDCDGTRTMIGEARWHLAANGQSCEFAASIVDGWQRQGFGTRLINHIAARVRSLGARYLLAEILHANKPAQRLVRKLGFHALPSNFDPKVLCFIKELEPGDRAAVAGAKPI
jgi:acetyltransferase